MLKTRIKSALINSGALRIASRFIDNGIAILMYHSVVENPAEDFAIFGGMAHSTAVFRQQMELLASEFHPITLDEAFLFVQGGEALPRRSVVVTFDDGYADNLQVAVPVLNQAGVPATFYVTVDCVEQRRLPWPSLLRYPFFTAKAAKWQDPEGRKWPLHDQPLRSKAFDRASEFCAKLAGREQDDFVAAVERQLQCAVMNGPKMMTWDEVRATAKQGHIVGSHTMTHPNMAYIGEDALRTELAESRMILERELNDSVVHFSYPCPALQPHWTKRTIALSRESGYRTAVTTDAGLVHKNDNPLRLRRVRPTKNVEGLRANLEVVFAGFRA